MTAAVALAVALLASANAAPADARAPATASSSTGGTATGSSLPSRVLVLDVKAAGVDAAAARAATAAVAQAIGERANMTAVTESELAALVDTAKAKAVLDCSASAECLAEISRFASARFVVSGTLGRLGKTTTLTLSLSDAASVTVVAREAAAVDVDGAGSVGTVGGGGGGNVAGGVGGVDVAGALATAAHDVCARLFGDAPNAKRFKLSLAKGEHQSFAVFPLELQNVADIDPAVAKSLTDILAIEIKRVDGTTVVSIDDVAAMVSAEQKKSVLKCTDDASCLAEIGAALDVDRLVVSGVGKVADTFVVTARLLDVKNVRVLSRVSESFVGPDEQLLRAVRRAGRELLGASSSAPGALVVSTPEVGAHVFVDGAERGRTPTAPITGVAPGRHALRVVQDGFIDWQGDVYVDSGETTAQWAPLEERPMLVRPFVPAWAFYGIVGASALALAGGGVVGGLSALAQNDYDARALASTKAGASVAGETELMPLWNRTEALATAADALLVAGAAAGVVALVAVPVVDFE